MITVIRHKYLTLFILSLAVILFFIRGDALAKSVFVKNYGLNELEVELDPYYSAGSYYISLSKIPIPCLIEDKEIEIYKNLFRSSYIPKFLLVEASVYPMPCLGVHIRDNYPNFYESANITKNFNLIRSICAGFEEPAALSLFLGNVVSFKAPGQNDCSGKGYMGYLFSIGQDHIKDSILIDDNWFEFEWKVKGTKTTTPCRMDWSFRIGAKMHDNPYITDTVYFSLRRSRTDYECRDLSPVRNIFKNSSFEYTFWVSPERLSIIRQLIMAGKKYPSKKKIVFELKVGLLWESPDKYSGPLRNSQSAQNFQIVLRPNIEF